MQRIENFKSIIDKYKVVFFDSFGVIKNYEGILPGIEKTFKYLEEQGIFNVESIRKMKQQLLSASGGDITAQLWAIVVFQYWYKKNIE